MTHIPAEKIERRILLLRGAMPFRFQRTSLPEPAETAIAYTTAIQQWRLL